MTTKTTSTQKSNLGQFYTTKYEYILQTFSIPNNIPIIEPFAGNGDLLQFIKTPITFEDKSSSVHLDGVLKRHQDIPASLTPNLGVLTTTTIECYDIDPKQNYIIHRDTLLNPPSFAGKYVLTNPPYLAKNKSADKTIYSIYGCDDLYKCFIELLNRNICYGGIIIVPLNFISSVRANDVGLRQRFVSIYTIERINIFEEQVFDDTTYTVCSIQFRKRTPEIEPEQPTVCTIFPSKKQIVFGLTTNNNYTIGGEIYSLPQSTVYKIERATRLTKKTECITNVLAKCIDDSIRSKIQLRITSEQDRYIDNTPNLTERSYATLVIEPSITETQQHELVEKVNQLLEEYREKYNSLFLANYRESNTIARKRISFGLVFQLCGHILGAGNYVAPPPIV
jgi:hypothetical protein